MYLSTIIVFMFTLVFVKCNKIENLSTNLIDDKLQQTENLVHIMVQSNELSAKLANCNDELLKKDVYIFERNEKYVDKLTKCKDDLLQKETDCHSKIDDLKLKGNQREFNISMQYSIEAQHSKYLSNENHWLKEEMKKIKSDLQASEKSASLLLSENERLQKEIQNLIRISQTEIHNMLDGKIVYTTEKIETTIPEKDTEIETDGTVISKTTNQFNAEKTTNHTIRCPNGRSHNNSRALYNATRKGIVEEVKRLLQACEDPDGIFISNANPYNDSSLLTACISEQKEVAKILLEFGADVNYANSHGNTALNGAAIHGNNEIIKMLLAHGARINSVNQWNQNAVYLSIFRGSVETLKLLIDAGGDVNVKTTDGKTPLSAAKSLQTDNKMMEVISLLKAAGAKE